MFVNYCLDQIRDSKVVLEDKNQTDDLKMIIKVFISEGFHPAYWRLFEIAKSDGKRIYGFEGNIVIDSLMFTKKEMVYMKIENEKVIPCYFKNHDLDGYSEFQAGSIEEAIKLYEKSYKPKIFDGYTDDVMPTNSLEKEIFTLREWESKISDDESGNELKEWYRSFAIDKDTIKFITYLFDHINQTAYFYLSDVNDAIISPYVEDDYAAVMDGRDSLYTNSSIIDKTDQK